ncbi:hypothetical protein [Paenibacillus sp. FSL R5-0490]|uniref:hypothetical protein n=1 Tax=Paenibacillus sp. FSL R5-0490 TaxID=1920424 RepID=UPI00158CF56C|nr:hypothetical protein [Paenibacillus sp. FSL R5-0490]
MTPRKGRLTRKRSPEKVHEDEKRGGGRGNGHHKRVMTPKKRRHKEKRVAIKCACM